MSRAARDRVLARDVFRDLGFDRKRARARNLARGLARDLACDLALDREVDGKVAFAHDLAVDLVRDLDLAIARDLVLTLDRALALAHDVTRDLDLVMTIRHLCVSASRLEHFLHEPRQDTCSADAAALTPPRVAAAAGLTRCAVRVLPAASRVRYQEEFASELHELAVAKVSWWAQLMYGVRLLDRAWVLRAELRDAVAQRART